MKKLSILASLLALLINFAAVADDKAAEVTPTGVCSKEALKDQASCEKEGGVWTAEVTQEAPASK